MSVRIEHWHYNDGWRFVPEILRKIDIQSYEFEEELVGWHCWAYAEDETFEEWMTENMTGEYDCTFRFNGGNPMYTVLIKNEQDAALFRLKWP